MPSIADQVATLEHDLTAALAQIDQLVAANAAFDSANASLRRENIALQLELNDMKHYVDDTRAMVRNLANSALELLRASRRHVGPAMPEEKPAPVDIDRTPSPYWKNRDSLDEKIIALPEKWPAKPVAETGTYWHAETQQAVAEIMQSDSGDEHQPWHPADVEEQDAGNANALSSQAPEEEVTLPPPNKFEPLPIFLNGDKPRAIFG